MRFVGKGNGAVCVVGGLGIGFLGVLRAFYSSCRPGLEEE